MTPRILLLDCETAPSLGWFWDLYETNIIETEQEWFMLSIAFKWLDQKKTVVYALPDFPLYKKDKTNDRALMEKAHEFLSQADLIVGHNSDSFDLKKINARLIAHGFNPPPPHKTVDTLKAARRHFKFNSNKLDELGRYFGIGRKLAHTGKHLWLACIRGDPKAWRKMKAYNKRDVVLLESVYIKLRPWMSNHPNLNAYEKKPKNNPSCPVCKSDNVFKRGFSVGGTVKTIRRQRYQCRECGKWFQGDIISSKKKEI